MILKKIEMAGFKSFADKTVVEFNDGFTAIVGPNGCGKSNVADAIRWVLGEQKVKDLRADSMQDVIFNGTEKRKSLSYCEVSLYFDNSTRYFDFDYDELIITRKLYRSGESEYLINHNTCLLRDINNVLYNSGLGKSGYSIIGQGKITEIVESKPESRRGMFEDAAGIAKYKKEKTDAERKLETARTNLERVGDIIQEIDRQMGPLKRQAENARKYLDYKADLKDLEVNAYIYQYENANDFKAKIREKLDAIGEELALRNDELQTATTGYDEAMTRLTNFDLELSKLNAKILELTVNLEKQEGESRLARERVILTQKENDRLNLDETNANKMLELSSQMREKKLAELAQLQEKYASLEKSFDELSQSYAAAAHELEITEIEAGKSQEEFIQTLGSLSDVKSNMSKYLTEKELLSTNLDNISKQTEESHAKKTELERVINALETEISIKEGRAKSLEDERATRAGKVSALSRQLQDFESNKQNKTTELKVYENRLKLLTEMQAEFEGYNYAVKKLLKLSSQGSALSKNIVGVVASLIKVPENLETAIEVALGNSVQNIVTFDETGAKELVDYLKANNFGRATFLPISSMKRRSVDVRAISSSKGYIGIASDLIKYDSKIDNVISGLLGGTIIVEKLIDAIEISKKSGYSYKIVSLEGDVINPQGSITGGSKKSEAVGIMSREREIETLKKEVENLSSFLKNAESQKRLLEEEFKLERDKFDSTSSALSALSLELSAAKTKLDSLKDSLNTLSDDVKLLEMEKQTVSNKLQLVSAEYEKSSLMKSALSGNETDANEVMNQRRKLSETLRVKRDSLSANLTTVKVELASAKANIDSVKNELLRLENEIGTQNENLRLIALHIEDNNKFIAAAEAMIKEKLASAPASEAKAELKILTEKQKKTEEDKTDISAQIRILDSKKASLMEEISRINDKKFREEMNLSKIDTDIETMQERIYEEYSLSYNDCLDLKRPDFDIKVAMPEIARIKKAINALGPINVNAIEDCSALLERYNTLTAQSDDLKKAEEDLTKIIKDLSSIMVEKFLTELNKIGESFKITFRELFGGGNAKLELVDEEHPLESGVEIFVQPPGKKIQNMSLYSGGEKSLTAMALIFAILRIKPLPFCLFDEVEAALDDSNVEIVDKYLKKLSDSTQFILITHKKPTMEYAESLFGVTMEEKGISKVVSVKLSDAIKQAEVN